MRTLGPPAVLACTLAGLSHGQVSLQTNDLVYDPFSRSIYASVPSSVGVDGNSITPIDPFTQGVGTATFVGSEPGKLALADDGSCLYVGLDGAAAVRRFDLASATAGLQFSVGIDPFFGPLYVEDIEVMPGSPDTVAISRQRLGVSPKHGGVGIYVDGVLLPSTTPDHTGSNVIEFSDGPGVLYGYNNETTDFGFRTMSVDAGGVQITGVASSVISGFFQDIEFQNGRVYATTGAVVDAASSTLLGTFSGVSGGLVEPDPFVDRVYFLTGSGSVRTLHAFDANTFVPLGTETISGVVGNATSLVRWGIDGIAFRTDAGQVHLERTDLVGPFLLDVSTSSPTVSSGESVSFSIDLAANGLAETADLYLGVALPGSVALLQFTSPALGTTPGAITDLAGLDPFFEDLPLSGALTFDGGEVGQLTWTGAEPAGTYTLYFVAVRAGSLADGAADPGDVLFADTAPVVFTPWGRRTPPASAGLLVRAAAGYSPLRRRLPRRRRRSSMRPAARSRSKSATRSRIDSPKASRCQGCSPSIDARSSASAGRAAARRRSTCRLRISEAS